MANNRIGCSAGKTSLIDPNNFYGQSSSNNMSVPLEDLNISVQLTTSKKGRTLLSADKTVKTSESSKSVSVTFIEGSVIDGQKVLTSKFTDLTTVFDKDNDSSENLGITNIDVDFNSSYAPLITINFIDLRGSSIFQNESQLNNNENKYSVFFQLPYPLYELTIKGYYGQPVKYCLHMTKFNSKFNAQSGNFEITANFVGYTYAMLSDMLLGILKAIPYTTKGKDKYKDIKETTQPNILNLNELSVKITEIDKNIEKLAASNQDAARLKTLKELDVLLDLIRKDINEHGHNLGVSISSKDIIVDYNYIPHKTGSEPSTYYTDTYLPLVSANIKEFNENGALIGGYYIDLKKFTDLGAVKYPKITFNKLNDEKVTGLTDQKQLANELNSRSSLLVNDYEFDLYNATSLFDIIDKNKTRIEKDITTTEKKIAMAIKNSISTSFGFDPTIRNIVNVFTVAVEVYLSVMFEVSQEAEISPKREVELKSVFKSEKNSDLKTSVASKFYPWPDYRENSGVDGFQEKYLGNRGVLKNPDNVDELIFIDDLYQGFLTARKISDEALLDLESDTTTTWLPSNPFDTLLYNDIEPYSRLGNTASADDVMVFALIRFMTYIAHTNSKGLLTDKKLITNFAEVEAKAIIDNKLIPDSSKLVLSQQNEGGFINIEGRATDKNTSIPDKNPVIRQNGNQYYYDYIFTLKNPNGLKVLPISGPLKDNNSFINSDYNYPTNGSTNETLVVKSYKYNFLTNYINYDAVDEATFGKKIIDGGKYVDIISPSYFQSKINGKEFPVDDTKIITLSDLKAGTGIDILNGIYGITEFKNINLNTTLQNTSIISVFYQDKKLTGSHNHDYEDINGFSYKRTDGIVNKFDLKYNTTRYSPTTQVLFKYGATTNFPLETSYDFNSPMRKYYGSNRYCIDRLIKGDFNFKYPYIEQDYIGEGKNSNSDPQKISLFGSKLYYLQDKKGNLKEYNRALLFLNTIPWNGNSFESSEILNLFKIAGGFIHAPKLWCAYIGGLLWRADSNKPDYDSRAKIVSGGSGVEDPILWNRPNTSTVNYDMIYEVPTKTQHWKILQEEAGVHTDVDYEDYSELLLDLPIQIKKEFKTLFFNFVNGDSDKLEGITWIELKNELEIWEGDSNDFYDFINGIYNNLDCSNPIASLPNYCKVGNGYYNNAKLNTNNYSIITPVSFQNDVKSHGYNMALGLEIDDDSYASTILTKALIEEVVIVNAGYAIWDKTLLSSSPTKYHRLIVTEENLNIYIKTMIDKFKGITQEMLTKEKEVKLSTFGTEDKDVIKFQLYKTCKNVYDKWIGGATDKDNIIFQCGGSTPIKNGLDDKMRSKLRPNDAKERLIDSFRFVTRSFKDIGDDFFIDPRPVNTYLTDNPNSSFYDAVSNLLASNNFDFIPLPSYINYNNPEVMESIFEPYSYQEHIIGGTCGPSFVCVYVGQKSKHLDFAGSEYTNDGIDIQCNDGNMITKLPADFTENNTDYENNVAVFKVAYSQQNQNIFKDIILDQSEFTETEESLKIIDDISKTGSENQRHFGGQNLYSVYGVRSYKAEVEMMGNAMIQPMMYFQLDNIPMFHGAYMITHVKHSIKPNSMSTNFTGVRIRFPETPLLKANELYMSLLENVEITATPTKPITSCSAKDLANLTTKGTKYDSNQLKVKNIAKSWGLNKIQTAAMMGNMMQECGFNPLKFNSKDYGGTTDLGLIQWNSKYTPPPKGSNPGQSDLVLSKQMFINYLGDTVEKQMKFVPTTNYYTDWTSDNKTKTDIRYSTWKFGVLVEICHNCSDRSFFETDKEQCKRTPYAEDFLKRFNDSSDPLKW